MNPAFILQLLGLVAAPPLSFEGDAAAEVSEPIFEMAVEDDGIDAEHFHDSLFRTEVIARGVLGQNLPRIQASMGRCSEAVGRISNGKVADVGGGCGLVCFPAAMQFPKCKFDILDRSRNALALGRAWADRLGLDNISFRHLDYRSAEAVAELGRDYALVMLEYVLRPAESEDEDLLISKFTPALIAAAAMLSWGATLQVGFGDFGLAGLEALCRSAYRQRLTLEDGRIRGDGCCFVFSKRSEIDHSEEEEVIRLYETIALDGSG